MSPVLVTAINLNGYSKELPVKTITSGYSSRKNNDSFYLSLTILVQNLSPQPRRVWIWPHYWRCSELCTTFLSSTGYVQFPTSELDTYDTGTLFCTDMCMLSIHEQYKKNIYYIPANGKHKVHFFVLRLQMAKLSFHTSWLATNKIHLRIIDL